MNVTLATISVNSDCTSLYLTYLQLADISFQKEIFNGFVVLYMLFYIDFTH